MASKLGRTTVEQEDESVEASGRATWVRRLRIAFYCRRVSLSWEIWFLIDLRWLSDSKRARWIDSESVLHLFGKCENWPRSATGRRSAAQVRDIWQWVAGIRLQSPLWFTAMNGSAAVSCGDGWNAMRMSEWWGWEKCCGGRWTRVAGSRVKRLVEWQREVANETPFAVHCRAIAGMLIKFTLLVHTNFSSIPRLNQWLTNARSVWHLEENERWWGY